MIVVMDNQVFDFDEEYCSLMRWENQSHNMVVVVMLNCLMYMCKANFLNLGPNRK
jgi:hypothetical protein